MVVSKLPRQNSEQYFANIQQYAPENKASVFVHYPNQETEWLRNESVLLAVAMSDVTHVTFISRPLPQSWLQEMLAIPHTVSVR
jgi:hypothetical protein